MNIIKNRSGLILNSKGEIIFGVVTDACGVNNNNNNNNNNKHISRAK
jgi:hypothetical protein